LGEGGGIFNQETTKLNLFSFFMQYTEIKHIFLCFKFTSNKFIHVSDKQDKSIVSNQIKSQFYTTIMHSMESQYNM